MFRRIGQGFCGTVWTSAEEHETKASAIKREDGGLGRSLYNDYTMHMRVVESLSAIYVRVPGCHRYVDAKDQCWWDTHLAKFPENFQSPCNALLTDRIPPFTKKSREALIDAYCPASLRSTIKASEPDRDCLVRLYLGRRRHPAKQSRFDAFSLRNYPLHIDQVEELGLDALLYARTMAEALAEIHWRAHIDANDVEFVLAPPRESSENGSAKGPSQVIKSSVLGEHAMWILDFDCCRNMPCDEYGVEQAVAAFFGNDPYYTRPGHHGNNRLFWEEFRDRFLSASEMILGPESAEACLPGLWVRLVEQRGLNV